MFLTVHATTALVITKAIPHPLVAFLIGFISHYILDAIPHGDEDFFNKFGAPKSKSWKIAVIIVSSLDFIILTFWLAFLLLYGELSPFSVAMAAVIGSILPDFLNAIDILTQATPFSFFGKINTWSHHLIIKKPITPWIGFSIQALFAAMVLYTLFTF